MGEIIKMVAPASSLGCQEVNARYMLYRHTTLRALGKKKFVPDVALNISN
jgi:hypothetical protein